MRIGILTGLVQGLIDRRFAREFVRYTPECAYCGVPDDDAFRYADGWSVCRECHAAQCVDGI